MKLFKYHALGNDYLVIDPADAPGELTPEAIRAICHRHYGAGSDGILHGPLPSDQAPFGLRIFNPDGSEAEKSGNGLRIFARYLWDKGRVRGEAFRVATLGGVVECMVQEEGRVVRVDMGRVSFHSADIPVTGEKREVIEEEVQAGDRVFRVCAATVGNPHCVVPLEAVDAALARRYGPLLEMHPMFPQRTNVQFMRVRDRGNIEIEIWERGAGYTLASGSSSSAAAAVAHKLGRCDGRVTVHMPGGRLAIEIGPDYAVRMTGPVTPVWRGELDEDVARQRV